MSYEHYEERIAAWKDRLGILRVPLGVFLLLLGIILAITPLTPGSWLALLIGLELLNLRERVLKWIRSWWRKS